MPAGPGLFMAGVHQRDEIHGEGDGRRDRQMGSSGLDRRRRRRHADGAGRSVENERREMGRDERLDGW